MSRPGLAKAHPGVEVAPSGYFVWGLRFGELVCHHFFDPRGAERSAARLRSGGWLDVRVEALEVDP